MIPWLWAENRANEDLWLLFHVGRPQRDPPDPPDPSDCENTQSHMFADMFLLPATAHDTTAVPLCNRNLSVCGSRAAHANSALSM